MKAALENRVKDYFDEKKKALEPEIRKIVQDYSEKTRTLAENLDRLNEQGLEKRYNAETDNVLTILGDVFAAIPNELAETIETTILSEGVQVEPWEFVDKGLRLVMDETELGVKAKRLKCLADFANTLTTRVKEKIAGVKVGTDETLFQEYERRVKLIKH